MRILIDATPLQTGHRHRGVGTYTRELLRALLRLDRDNEYRLIVHPRGEDTTHGPRDRQGLSRNQAELKPLGDPGDQTPATGAFEQTLWHNLPANASLVTLPRPRWGRMAGFVTHQALMPALLARHRADVFHSPGFVAAFSVPGVPWCVPMPLVITLHDFIPWHVPEISLHKPLNRRWYRWQMHLARRAQRLICVSEATRQDAIRFLGVEPERCVVIPEGVDRSVFHPAAEGRDPPAVPSDLPVDQPFILFVGGDYPNKNRPVALAAFGRLTQATTLPHHLVLVGPDKAADAQLGEAYPGLDVRRVHRLPRLSQAQLAQLYRQADVFLFPSTHEGFGLPVLEAMASGAPVIVSSASSLPEVAGDAAILVDPYDVDAMAAAMGQVLADNGLRRQLIAAGLARAAMFSWEAMAMATLEAYHAAQGAGDLDPGPTGAGAR